MCTESVVTSSAIGLIEFIVTVSILAEVWLILLSMLLLGMGCETFISSVLVRAPSSYTTPCFGLSC